VKLKIIDENGKDKGSINLWENISLEKVNTVLLHELIQIYMANQRRGTACTKMRSEVRGGGVKPWKQKGTGRARVGSIRSPLWKGGGITFGPKPRDYRCNVPKKEKKLALMHSILDKNNNGNLFVINKVNQEVQKTKEVADWFKLFGIKGEILIVLSEKKGQFEKMARNIPYIKVTYVNKLSPYEVLHSEKVILVEKAVNLLNERFGEK